MKLDKQRHTLHVKCNGFIMKRYISINLIPDSEISQNDEIKWKRNEYEFIGETTHREFNIEFDLKEI